MGRSPGKVGPGTTTNGSGSKNGVEMTHTLSWRLNIRPVRDHSLFDLVLARALIHIDLNDDQTRKLKLYLQFLPGVLPPPKPLGRGDPGGRQTPRIAYSEGSGRREPPKESLKTKTAN